MDARIVPTDFDEDWRAALKRRRGRRAGVPGPLAAGCRPAAALLIILAVILVTARFQSGGPADDPAPRNRLAAPAPFDPNRSWYGPTDDLLQVNVLWYESQWVTFADYNPVTMEMR